MPDMPANAIHPSLTRYHPVAQLLHWLTALLIVAAFGLGLYMVGLKISPTKLKLFSYHKWIGVTIFAVVVLRLMWRWHCPPPAPVPMPEWQRRAADVGHKMLYALLLLVPLAGWLASSAKGFQTVYFAVLPIPDLIGKNAEAGEALQTLHWALNKTLLLLVLGHIVAALKHQFIDRDGTLLRMLPALFTRRNT